MNKLPNNRVNDVKGVAEEVKKFPVLDVADDTYRSIDGQKHPLFPDGFRLLTPNSTYLGTDRAVFTAQQAEFLVNATRYMGILFDEIERLQNVVTQLNGHVNRLTADNARLSRKEDEWVLYAEDLVNERNNAQLELSLLRGRVAFPAEEAKTRM